MNTLHCLHCNLLWLLWSTLPQQNHSQLLTLTSMDLEWIISKKKLISYACLIIVVCGLQIRKKDQDLSKPQVSMTNINGDTALWKTVCMMLYTAVMHNSFFHPDFICVLSQAISSNMLITDWQNQGERNHSMINCGGWHTL